MDPRWAEIKRIFQAAIDLPESSRQEYVRRECAGDSQLRNEIERLLNGFEGTSGAFAPPIRIPERREDQDAKTALTAGQVLCRRFKVHSFIAAGGMGEVYEAEDTELSERVALKTIRAEIASDPRTLERFRREAQQARRIPHPNVCRVYDLFTDQTPTGELRFLTMELLHGPTLSQRIKADGPLKPAEALPLLRQLADALDAAHTIGLVHRDFKSGNIMLQPTEDGGQRAVITDFGLARTVIAAGEHTHPSMAGDMGGTPAYMAPEQALAARPTPAMDIYALGVVAYQMVTGRLPFDDAPPLELMARKNREAPVSPASYAHELPASWAHAILQCLEIDPTKRFATAREFVTAVADPQYRSGAPARKSTRSRRALVAILAFVLAAGAMLAALVTHRSRIAVLMSARSVVVTPLTDCTGTTAGAAYAHGLADELIALFSQQSSFRVVSRSAALQQPAVEPCMAWWKRQVPFLRKTSESAKSVARRFESDVVVSGTVEAIGAVYRFTTVVRLSDGSIAYQRSHDGPRESPVIGRTGAIMDLAQVFGSAPGRTRLTPAQHMPATAAYEQYVLGRQLYLRRNTPDIIKAIEHYQAAAQGDKKFAAAYAALAEALHSVAGKPGFPLDEKIKESRRAALTARELDSRLAEAHTALGLLQHRFEWEWEQAERSYEEAVAIAPGDATVRLRYAGFLSDLGRANEAIQQIEKARELDPDSFAINTTCGILYVYARRYDDALRQLARAVSIDTTSGRPHAYMGLTYMLKGDKEAGMAAYRRAVELETDADRVTMLTHQAQGYAFTGNRIEAEKVLNSIRESLPAFDPEQPSHRPTWDLPVRPVYVAGVHALLGDLTKTMSWLTSAYEGGDPDLTLLQVHPIFDRVRSTKPFQELVARVFKAQPN